MDTEPRNFKNSYPLGGEKIGPAWRQAWRALDVKRWTPAGDVEQMGPAAGVLPGTMRNLLRQAVKAGQLEVRYVKAPSGQKRAEYRVTC
jgi:hypothetical protein